MIKAYVGLSVPMVTQLAAEGKKAGLRVFIDQGRRNGSVDLMNAGIAAFAHLPTYELAESAIELAKTRQISFITTLSVHHELELLVEAGLTPLEAISSATRNASPLMNAADWGTLEPGKLADVLVIDGQPDRNIKDTYNVEIVIKEGAVLNRRQLRFDAARDAGFRTSTAVSAVPRKE